MKVAIFGSTGQTGFQVVKQLLDANISIKAIARNDKMFSHIPKSKYFEIVIGNISEMEDNQLKDVLHDIDTVVSCLGHNISLTGIYGKPHYLVSNSLQKIIKNLNTENNQKIILINTTACINRELLEKYTIGEQIVMNILRILLPPQRDNEKALKILMDNKKMNQLQWIAIRPDTLISTDKVSEYKVFETIQRSPIFNAGKTSRINVANFMKELIIDSELWDNWVYKTPVIYNIEEA